jgi:large subunit ribosomal protein L17
MRHRVAHRKLNRTTEHRLSLLRNLAASLMIGKGRIRTTLTKAKELRPFVEKLVTLGKKDSLHARRRALSIVPRKDAIAKLFNEISPRFADRPGGYTRILKLGPRRGDGAEMAFIEFVDYTFAPGKEAKDTKAAKPVKETKKPAKEAKEKKKPEAGAKADEEESEVKAKKKATKKATKKAAKKSAKKTTKKTTKKATKKTAAKKTAKKAAKKKTRKQ